MMRRPKKQIDLREQTIMAFAVGCFAWTCFSSFAEIVYGFLTNNGEQVPGVPSWRAHMGSACLGLLAFVLTLFLLEILGRKSKAIAWSATYPWIPLIPLLVLATVIHIHAYIVIVLGLIYSVWAFRRMLSIL